MLIGSFYAYLVDQKNKESEIQKYRERYLFDSECNNVNTTISWIEKLLQTPIKDGRKFAILWIIAPYLINNKSLTEGEAFDVTKKWTILCNEVERLNPPNFNNKIKECIKYAINSKKTAMGLQKLKSSNEPLYTSLKDLKVT